VDIVIHDCRRRLGMGEGKAQYGELGSRFGEGPLITVPTITLEADATGAPHPGPGSHATKFSGPYSHRTIEGGVGRDLPKKPRKRSPKQ
jgi:hypothetical protein